jgi:invasion protein IalB
MMKRLFFPLLLCGALCASAAAQTARPAPPSPPSPPPATQPAATPAPVTDTPEATVATFGDWSLRCVRQGDGAQANRVCEVMQGLQIQGQSQPIAQLAFGRIKRGDPLRITAAVPANLSFPSTLRLLFEENDRSPIEVAWARCLPGGCFATSDLSAAAMQRLRGRNDPIRMIFRDAAGRDISLPLSMRGLTQALDALAKEG